MSKLTIGLFGFGVVGEGIYQVLNDKPEFNAEIKQVVIKDPAKERAAPANLFSNDPSSILNDEEINLVVELISDADAAYEIVMQAFRKGKSVISANKKMIAEHHLELIEASQKYQVSFLYEGAVCGSVPIIRNLEEYFDNDLLQSISGIVNGSTNYILSKMHSSGQSFSDSLKEAQANGFAEENASLDVDGFDAGYKLSIMALHGFGQTIGPDQIIRKGIASLSPADIQFAKEKKQVIKLMAECKTDGKGKLKTISVLPAFVSENSALGRTENEYNGVLVISSLADEQFLSGKGAGRFPTSSAVLSDISAFKYGYRYAYKKGLVLSEVKNEDEATFYISRKPSVNIDENLFNTVISEYQDAEIQTTIGQIAYSRLVESKTLEHKDISVIRLPNGALN